MVCDLKASISYSAVQIRQDMTSSPQSIVLFYRFKSPVLIQGKTIQNQLSLNLRDFLLFSDY